jgi:DNA-binding beta-propeller fold protein YncE
MKPYAKSISMLLIPFLMIFSYCSQKEATETQITEEEVGPTLTFLWETDDQLTTCESVLYDPASGQIFVSNIEGDGTDKDGVGSISIIDREGNIVNRDWVKGLNAPKGMAIKSGSLFVTDIDELLEIDIASATVVKRYPVQGALFLNDAATDGSEIYFSDMRTGKIHKIENGEVKTVAENQTNINGLQFNNQGELFGLDAEGLKKYNENGDFTIINSNVTGGDGLEYLGDQKWLASRWQGEVYLIDGESETKLLDTKDQKSNTADIGYIKEDRILLVPTFMKNKVVAYKLNY